MNNIQEVEDQERKEIEKTVKEILGLEEKEK